MALSSRSSSRGKLSTEYTLIPSPGTSAARGHVVSLRCTNGPGQTVRSPLRSTGEKTKRKPLSAARRSQAMVSFVTLWNS